MWDDSQGQNSNQLRREVPWWMEPTPVLLFLVVPYAVTFNPHQSPANKSSWYNNTLNGGLCLLGKLWQRLVGPLVAKVGPYVVTICPLVLGQWCATQSRIPGERLEHSYQGALHIHERASSGPMIPWWSRNNQQLQQPRGADETSESEREKGAQEQSATTTKAG